MLKEIWNWIKSLFSKTKIGIDVDGDGFDDVEVNVSEAIDAIEEHCEGED